MSDCDTIETLSGKPRLLPAKHDILYSKARFVLNQRYIKRPWFNLNPFLEKTDETIDLENFIPEESKYIQRLESLVLCETFTSELPVDTREIAIGEFFTYLYSGAWNHGCSIRVLEGQLLDELLLGLYRLERQGAAVRHTTHAIARNNRLRTGIYKHSVKKEHGSIAETLLLEFAYFGQLSKDRPNPKTIDPFEYLHKSVVVEREPVDEEPAAEMPSSTAVQPKLTAIPKMRNRALSLASPERIRTVNLSAPVEETTKSFWGTKGSLMSKPLQAITVVNSFKSSRQSAPEKDPTIAHGKRQSIALAPSAFPQLSFEKCNHDKRQSISAPQSAFQQLSFAKYNHEKRHSVATASIGFDKRMSFQSPISGLGSIIDNRKDPSVDRVKKKASSPDFDEDDEDCYVEKDVDDLLTPTEQADRDNFFGEELYLSDKRLHGDKQTKNMDTKQILRLKKKRTQGAST
ncbi:hypothetical protein DPMN_026706 [Dreissena polymorpha]|uniref:Uncharacterized protein n=1 Tax=Dreissena polymorpha TaxID=45954 RepID=A0A9D4RCV3_DREPO|nr:hypothetical protein DPMN_026706 [Dreissena polymorpha]